MEIYSNDDECSIEWWWSQRVCRRWRTHCAILPRVERQSKKKKEHRHTPRKNTKCQPNLLAFCSFWPRTHAAIYHYIYYYYCCCTAAMNDILSMGRENLVQINWVKMKITYWTIPFIIRIHTLHMQLCVRKKKSSHTFCNSVHAFDDNRSHCIESCTRFRFFFLIEAANTKIYDTSYFVCLRIHIRPVKGFDVDGAWWRWMIVSWYWQLACSASIRH